jgi:FkbM family methyltransferase
VFFDIGANVGQTSVSALTNFSDARIIAFEPDRTTFDALSKNIDNTRFQPFNLALSDKIGEAQFFDYGALATSNSLVEDSQYATHARHPATVRTVQCDTVDEFRIAHGIERIDVLKIDTEGHEMGVLRGAAKTLASKLIRFVYVEFNTLMPKAGTTGGALLPISELLEPLGFRFVASYAEFMITTGDLFVTSNALFVYNSP